MRDRYLEIYTRLLALVNIEYLKYRNLASCLPVFHALCNLLFAEIPP